MRSAAVARGLVAGSAPLVSPEEQPRGFEALAGLITARTPNEGLNIGAHPDVRYYRFAAPITFRKMLSLGPMLTVVAQGRKKARFGTHTLSYDPCHYLVITGETECEGMVVEAPYLAVCMDIPADVVAKTLLALAEADAPVAPPADSAPAFVSGLNLQIKETLLRFLAAIEDPVERRVVAPLILEELVFRLLRTDAAAILRRAVGREPDAQHIMEAMRFMRANASKPLSVESIARHVAMSASHFAHRFRAVALVTPMRYLKQLRMHEARTMMLASGLRVSEVATQVGYESASHFSRDFKTYFGTAPAEFARALRSQDPARDAQP